MTDALPLARPDPAFLAAPQGFPLWRAVTFVVSWAFLALAIALVYRILPDAKIAWRDVWVGAGVRALLFLLGNHLIGWYLGNQHHFGLWGGRIDRDCPAVGLLLFAGRAVRRGVHTSLHQTPRRVPGTENDTMRINRKKHYWGIPRLSDQ